MRRSIPLELSLSGLYFFYFAHVGVLLVYLPKILLERGFSALEIGILYALVPLTRFIVPFLFWRWLSLEARFFYASLWGVLGAVVALGFLPDSFALLWMIYLWLGVATSLIQPYSDTVALWHLGKERYGKVRLFGSLGFVFSIYLLADRFLEWGFTGVYLLVVTVLMVLCGLGIQGGARVEAREEGVAQRFPFRQTLWLWVSIFLFQLSFGGFYNFFTIYALDRGFAALEVSHLWIFGVACEVVMLLFQAGILRRFSLPRLIGISLFLSALRWSMLSLLPSEPLWWYLAQSLHAFSFALYHTAMIAYLFSLPLPRKLAQQFYAGIGYGLGAFFGSLLSGALYGKWLFLYMGLLALLSYGAFSLHARRE